MRMRSSGRNLARSKHFEGSDPTYQVSAQSAQLILDVAYGGELGASATTSPSTPLWVDPHKRDIVRIHLAYQLPAHQLSAR